MGIYIVLMIVWLNFVFTWLEIIKIKKIIETNGDYFEKEIWKLKKLIVEDEKNED